MQRWREMRIGLGVFALLTGLALALAHPAFAQSDAVTITIPPQELSTALAALAEQTNLQVLYASELASGRMAKGLAGTFTPQEAVSQLLEGTGLQYTFTDTKTVTLQRAAPITTSQSDLSAQTEGAAPKQRPIKVPEVMVKDVKERGYTAEETSSATRIPVPVQELPRSVEVITRQVMDDQKAIRLQDTLRNVSGLSMPNTQGGRAGDFMIRGFRSDLNVFKNGFREDSTYGARASRDVINLQNVEVVKGPPAYLYGRSDPGGVINQITKDPLKTPYYSSEVIFGNYNLYRPTMDVGGPLNESKTLTYRFNGAYESAQSFREGVKTDRIFLAPTIGWELGLRTTLRFEGEYMHDQSPIDRGLVAIDRHVADIPVGNFLGDPNRRGETNQGKATLILIHQFNDMWKWRTGFRSAAASEKYNSLESWFLDADNRTLNLAAFRIPQTVQSHYLQNEVHGQFATGSVKHRVLMGVELGREVQSGKTFTDNVCIDTLGTCTRSTIDIHNTNQRMFLDNPLGLTSDSTQTNGIVGIYAGDQIDLLDNLHLNAGARGDIFKQDVVNRETDISGASRDTKTDRAFSPSLGLTYQPVRTVALFVNFTQSFAPQGAGLKTIDGKLLNPERGRQYEAGVKLQTEDGRLRSTVAIFDIKKKNVAVNDPSQGPFSLFSLNVGEQRSRGVEFDVAGRLLPGWDIIANYAYIDARITKDEDFQIGSRLPNVPLHQASIWTTYFIQDGQLQGLGGGIGLYTQAKRNAVLQFADTSFDNQVDLPGFVRLDAAIYYRKNEIFPHTNLVASLNFKNLLGQRYFEGGQFREVIYPGAPLTMLAAVKLEYN